jgi:DsbC/DsbD-like thiol-disulfide interchange protein
MKNPIALLSTLLALLCLGSIAGAEPGNDKVQTETVADTSAIVPGKPFLVGFKFTIAPNWHIYWKNSGDSGLPTEIKFHLPDGFTAGELMFPTPARLALPGDILNYAYENQVMLMVKITPPKNLSVGTSVTLGAKASWLVCQDECLPGQGDVSIDLPVAETSTPANVDLFKQWTDQLPVKEDAADIASTSNAMAMSNGDGQATISIGWKKAPTDAQFIPGVLKNGDIETIKAVTTGDSTKITFVVKGFKGDEQVTGLVVFTSSTGAKRGVEVSIPPAAAAAH